MNAEKKWTDKEVINMMSSFVCNMLALRLLVHEVDEKITSFYKEIKSVPLEDTVDELKLVSNAVNAIIDGASNKSGMFIHEATLFLKGYKQVMNVMNIEGDNK